MNLIFSLTCYAQTPIKIAQDGKVGIDLPANNLPTQELHVDGNLRLTDHFMMPLIVQEVWAMY